MEYTLTTCPIFRGHLTFYREQFFDLLYGLVFAGGFLVFPATEGAPRDRIAIYDYALALLGLGIAFTSSSAIL